MTTLISWLGADSRQPASLYLASDSRISWELGSTWSGGRKLFACATKPAVLAYCGDVLSPTQILGQVVEMLDAGLLPFDNLKPHERSRAVGAVIAKSLSTYPPEKRFGVEVLFAQRFGERMEATFHLHSLRFDRKNALSVLEIPADAGPSRVLHATGSGAGVFKLHHEKWDQTTAKGTSRAVFSSLADAIRSGSDPLSGGSPQLVGLYRIGPGRAFGVIWEGVRYYYGTEVSSPLYAKAVKWHNDLFEICDPKTQQLADGAQPQPRPKGL